jgi:hypothetical protein
VCRLAPKSLDDFREVRRPSCFVLVLAGNMRLWKPGFKDRDQEAQTKEPVAAIDQPDEPPETISQMPNATKRPTRAT